MIERIEEIRHHIRIESAVQEGSQNMLKHLQVLKSVHKKALHEVVKHVLCLLETKCNTECQELSDFIQFYLLN